MSSGLTFAGQPTPAPTPYYNGGLSSYGNLSGINFSGNPVNVGQAYQTGGLQYNYGPANPNVLGASTTASAPSSQNSNRAPTQSNSPGNYYDTGANKGYFNGQFYNDYNKWLQAGGVPAGPQIQQISQQDVDNAYGEANNYYNDIYNRTLGGKQDFLNQYTAPYDALQPGIDTTYKQGQTLNQQQQGQVQNQSQSALDDAKRLFNELTQGVRQRFGGSNSAGEFANEFYGRQLQQNMGNIQNTTGQNMKSLLDKASGLQDQHSAQIQQLGYQKAAALSQAQDAFNQRLSAIDDARGQLAQQKAAMKIDALKDYKNTINQITMYHDQAATQLQQNQLAAANQIAQTLAAYKTYAGQNVDLNQIVPSAYSALGVQSPVATSNIYGYYDPTKRYTS